MIETLKWSRGSLYVLDQTKLPHTVEYIQCNSMADVAICIKNMNVRGAPAIGVTAAFGMVLALQEILENQVSDIMHHLRDKAETLVNTRPTAVNLGWAVKKMLSFAEKHVHSKNMLGELESLAKEIYEEDIRCCRAIGRHGGCLVPDEACILTHCNAGALATAGYGTALGVIRSAVELGKTVKVFADETRPFLQGARLTTWELIEDGIDTTLITDNMAAHLMAQGVINWVVVGADRIASNGDTANKIGTYGVALAAEAHQIPFYVAAPMSTIDFTLQHGNQIPIEERSPDEVTHFAGISIAPDNVNVRNPAFDVTPHNLISGIITERGVAYPPFDVSLEKFRAGNH